MEDQSQQPAPEQPETVKPEEPPIPPGRRVSPLVAVIVLIAIGLAVWAVTGHRKAFDAAAYLPDEVAVAASVDFSRTADKAAAREFILGVLKDAGVKDPESQMFKSIGKQLDVDAEKEVIPHLNGKGAAAVATDVAGGQQGVTLVVGARSPGQAKKLVDLVASKLEKAGTKFSTAKHEGFDYLRVNAGMAYVCVGAVGSGAVATLGEETFQKAVGCYKGKSNLAGSEYYRKYSAPGDSTVAVIYYSGPGFYKLISPYIGMMAAQMGPDALEQLKKAYESSVACAASIQATGSGLRAIVRALGTTEAAGAAPRPLDKLVEGIPIDAAFAVHGPDMDKLWGQAGKQMGSVPDEMAGLAMWSQRIKQMVGVDIFKDILDRMKSLTAYYVPRKASEPGGLPGDIVISLQVDKPEALRATLAKLNAAAVQAEGTPAKQAVIAGQKFTVGSFGPDAALRYADAVVGDRVMMVLTGGSADAAAKAMLAASQGKGRSLADSPRFQAAGAQLPAQSGVIMYGDVGTAVEALQEMFESAADRRIALGVVKKVGPFAMVASVKGRESEAILVAPFLK